MYGLTIIAIIIFSIVIFTGKKLIFKHNYFYSISLIIIISEPLNSAVENIQNDYMYILFTLIIFVPMYIFFVSIRKGLYIIENVKVNDLINIITTYFEDKNINYEVQEKNIYIKEDCKTIDIQGNWEVILDLKEIKKLSFYEELLEHIKFEIKNIEQKSFPFMGPVYLMYAGLLYWLLGWIKSS